jgi:hypothetical protein
MSIRICPEATEDIFTLKSSDVMARMKATLLFISAYMPVNNYYKFQAGKTGSSFTTCSH